ncbi:MAG: serine/threonine protein kinase [Deltaproteobacteria bacterium]|nr:serine/threonine protein kinase [Deltaproteobacteria bacterium]
MSESVPSKVGRYLIDRLIGAGAMGYVYVGKDPELGRAVAIKTIRDLGMDPASLGTFLERFKNEARAAARLHHPSIVQVYDVGEDEEVGPYLVFEYVPGKTLKEVIQDEGALAPPRIVSIADQIADALEVAHAEGIIHRDVKPDNLLATDDGRVKLADFGIARVPDAALTREGQFLGTPCYAAPETLMEGTYGPRSDLFSFAAVLYEVATGTRAFPGTDAVAVANKVVHTDPAHPNDVTTGEQIPPGVASALMRGLAKDPEERFRSSRDLADAIHQAYADDGVVLPSLVPRSSRSAPRAPGQSSRQPPGDSRGGSLPGAERGPRSVALWAMAIGSLAIGVALVFALSGPDDGAGVADGGAGDGDAAGLAAADTGVGAGDTGIVVLDAGPDGAMDAAPDTSDEIASLSGFEREQRAKDLVDAARAEIDRENWDQARDALDEARAYDPGNDDIGELLRRLPAGGS